MKRSLCGDRREKRGARCGDVLAFAVFVGCTVGSLSGLAGCAAERQQESVAASQQQGAAWVAGLTRAHQQADQAIARGDHDGARVALDRALEAPPPRGSSEEDVRVVRQDLCYRLADVELAAGRARHAIDWVERGLALGARGDLFEANLRVARGRAHEALGQDTVAAGDYHRALRINETLLDGVLDDTGPAAIPSQESDQQR